MLSELFNEIPVEGLWVLFLLSVLSLFNYRWGVMVLVTVFAVKLLQRYFGW